MRRRLLFQKEEVLPKYHLSGETCDAVFWDSLLERVIYVSPEDIDVKYFPPQIYTPIGVVVVPSSHNRYPEQGACGVMSIVPMSCDTPETGGTSEQGMYWGSTSTNPTGRYYTKAVKTSTNSSNVADGLSDSYYAYIPRQNTVGATPSRIQSPYAPSPYIGSDYKSGGYNKSYGTTEFDTSSDKNALSDFDGRGNTDKILAQRGSKNYDSWIPTYNTLSDYPAVSCCDMFFTFGTEQGDWYLPACGELGYIIPRLGDIQDTISKLNTAYGVGVQLISNNHFWSSSEYNTNSVRCITTAGGSVSYQSIVTNVHVRAFLRLRPTQE